MKPSHQIQTPQAPIRCLVVDDEEAGRDVLKGMIEKYCPELIVVAEAASVEEAADKAPGTDVIFLDIELPDGNGFDLLERTGTRDQDIIFVTAYNQFGIRAVKASATDYLLKPISSRELKEAVRRLLVRRVERIASTIEATYGKASNRLALPTGEEVAIVDIDDIIRCRSHSNYTSVHLSDGRMILVSKTLGDYDKRLTGQGFHRVHNSHLINLNHVRSYVRGKGGYVIMSDGTHVDVSSRRKEGLLLALGL